MSDVKSRKSEVWPWILAFALVIGVRVIHNVLGVWSWILSGLLTLLALGVLIINKRKYGRWTFWGNE